MRPIDVPISDLEQLPLCHRVTIPAGYLDILGHMNVKFYFQIFGEAAGAMMSSFGLSEEYIRNEHAGIFVLRQVINYLNEVRVGETVAVRGRVLGRSAKRLHKMYFMVNETLGTLAATSEVLVSHADLNLRRTSPIPLAIAERVDAMIVEMDRLDWPCPVSGIIQP